MKSILITGDVHGEVSRFSDIWFYRYYDELKRSEKNDNYIIVCGDFGFVWDNKVDGEITKREKYEMDILSNKPFNILFVDGNHENHFRLNRDFETVDFMGGKADKIRDNIYHLKRGEVYEIYGKKIFTFGGASSHDIADGILDINDPDWKTKSKLMNKTGRFRHRVRGYSWWEEELPSKSEMDHGLETLKKYNNEVDYIITHQPPENIMKKISDNELDYNDFTSYLQKIDEQVSYKTWFAGHMHLDKWMDDRHRQLYYEVECVYRE